MLLLFFSAETLVRTSPSLEDFAHCKDEMDVIIVHCGFRLCTVKLWTVNVWGNSYGKKWNHLKSLSGRLLCMSRFFSDCKCVYFTFSVHKLNS